MTSYSANIASAECLMTQPFAGFTLLLFTIRILAAQGLPARCKQKVIAHLDVHFRNLNCTSRMIRYVKLHIKRTHLLELKIVDYHTILVGQGQI